MEEKGWREEEERGSEGVREGIRLRSGRRRIRYRNSGK